MITNGYSDVDEFDEHTRIDDAVDDSEKERAIEAASRWIDSYCGRRFWKTASSTSRTFTACSRVDLSTGDLVSVTTLETDDDADGTYETVWAASDYRLWPWNPDAAPETRPYRRVVAAGDRRFPYVTPYLTQVKVTGEFGWPDVPTAVREACLLESVRLFRSRYSPDGVVAGIITGAGDFGFVSKFADPRARALLAPYRIATIG